MKISRILIILLTVIAMVACKKQVAENNRTPILEVSGKYLYRDQLEAAIPPKANKKDSTEIANNFIRKWVTNVLLYENAQRNVIDQDKIDRLLEDYRKTLIIHQYQEKMIEQKLPKEITDSEMQVFYNKYQKQFILDENVIKGILLVVPLKAPKIANVRSWVKSANTSSLEKIEKYSMQNAISYDYFGDRWIPLEEVLKRIPVKVDNPTAFVSKYKLFETTDSTRHYFLRIQDYKRPGQIEPYEMAKPRISNLMMNKLKIDFIKNFENELYEDAVKNKTITYYNKK